MRKANDAALAIVMEREGLRLKSYTCPRGVWTIGYGHTAGVDKGLTCTIDQARAWLREDLSEAESIVSVNAAVPLTDNQFSALVSFCFNVGAGNFTSSTLLSKLNAQDYLGAAEEFLRWKSATVDGVKTVLDGLVTRREQEKALFLTPDAAA